MNAPINIKLPPHSIEAEQSLLGGLLIRGESAWDRIVDAITPEDFYRDDHRRIFRHIGNLIERGQTVDVVTVSDSIEASNEADQTGGLAYLAEIANATPSAANITGYARVIVDRARLRQLIVFADEISALAFSPGQKAVPEILDEAEGRLMGLVCDVVASRTEPVAINTILGEVIADIDARIARTEKKFSGTPTGLADIDNKLDGLNNGDLIIIAGRPSMGKTALAINIAEHVAIQERIPVMVFSMEMSNKQLGARLISSCGGISGKLIKSGKLTDDDWDRTTVALGTLHDVPLVIDETPALSTAQIRARARRQARKHKNGLGLIVIDYLQLIRGSGENRHQELSAITKELKSIAKQLDCPVICLSQLSRKVEERADKRPMMSDLRESGAIEEDADVVMMVYRDDYYDEKSPWAGLAEILIRKNRSGECGDVKLVFQKEFSRFRDADAGAINEAREAARASTHKPPNKRAFSG